MTQDDPKQAPVDLRQFEFIQYDLARDQELIAKLDNAIQSTLGGDYAVLLDQTVALLQKFNADTSSSYSPASLEEFRARAIRGEKLEGLPAPDDAGFAEFVLPKVIAEATDNPRAPPTYAGCPVETGPVQRNRVLAGLNPEWLDLNFAVGPDFKFLCGDEHDQHWSGMKTACEN